MPLQQRPSTSNLGWVSKSTASRSREVILPLPAEFVSPPEQESFDILEQVQWSILVAGTQTELLHISLCFPIPQRERIEKTE